MKDALAAAYNKVGGIDYYSYEPFQVYGAGAVSQMSWVADVGDLWRSGADIRASWKSVLNNAKANNRWASNARPGHFNDADSARDNPFVCVRACCRNRCLLSVMLRGASCSARDREW